MTGPCITKRSLHGAGTWEERTASSRKAINAAFMAPFRRIVSTRFDLGPLSDAAVCQKLGIPTLDIAQGVQRLLPDWLWSLSFNLRLASNGVNVSFWTLSTWPQSFIASYQTWRSSRTMAKMASIHPWLPCCVEASREVLSAIARSPCQQVLSPIVSWPCYECGMTFKSSKALHKVTFFGDAHSNNADTLECLQQTVASVTKFPARCFSLICLWTGVWWSHAGPDITVLCEPFVPCSLVEFWFSKFGWSCPAWEPQDTALRSAKRSLSCAARLRQIHRFSCWRGALRGAPQSVQSRGCGSEVISVGTFVATDGAANCGCPAVAVHRRSSTSLSFRRGRCPWSRLLSRPQRFPSCSTLPGGRCSCCACRA